MSFAGIDVGQSGGIACLDDRGAVLLVRRMPRVEGEVSRLFEHELIPLGIEHAWIEKVHAFPDTKDKEGNILKQGQGVVSAFTFGRGAGVLIGCLLMAHIRFEEIEPRAWQKILGVPARMKKPKKQTLPMYPPEESQADFKRRLRARALQLFPGVDLNLMTADSLLLAEACRRISLQMRGHAVALPAPKPETNFSQVSNLAGDLP